MSLHVGQGIENYKRVLHFKLGPKLQVFVFHQLFQKIFDPYNSPMSIIKSLKRILIALKRVSETLGKREFSTYDFKINDESRSLEVDVNYLPRDQIYEINIISSSFVLSDESYNFDGDLPSKMRFNTNLLMNLHKCFPFMQQMYQHKDSQILVHKTPYNKVHELFEGIYIDV